MAHGTRDALARNHVGVAVLALVVLSVAGMIEEDLKQHKNKISPAASELGISRPTFYELMDKLGIKKPT